MYDAEQVGDYFGEIGAIAEERPGMPFKRIRSAYSLSPTSKLCALSYR